MGDLVSLNGQSPETRRRYSPEEVHAGLLTVAMFNGSTTDAARFLEEQAKSDDPPKLPNGEPLEPIGRSTLEAWANRNKVAEYQEIRKEHLPKVREQMAVVSEDLALRFARAEQATVDRFMEGVDKLSPRDAAGALRNITTARGISTDKASALRGLPTEVEEHITAEETLRRLKAIDSSYAIDDDDAEEITDAEEVPEPPAA